MKSRSSTQRLGPGTTRSGDCLRCDASAHQPRIGPGSSAPRRQTSVPGVRLHPTPTPVRSEIERVRASGATSTWRLGPGSTRDRGAPVTTHPLSGQASALACSLHKDGLKDPGFVFTSLPFLCARRLGAAGGLAQTQLPRSLVPLPYPAPGCPGHVIYISFYVLMCCRYVYCTVHVVVYSPMGMFERARQHRRPRHSYVYLLAYVLGWCNTL